MFNETLFSRHERAFVVIGIIVASVLISFGLFALVAILMS
jgi:hypothetical protein